MRRRLTITAASTLIFAAACGKVGPPLAPLPRGPLAPGRVVARQIGSRVKVAFDVPRARGSRPTQQPVRAELVRVAYAPGIQPAPDPEAFRRNGTVVGQAALDGRETAGRASVEDVRLGELPGAGRDSTLRYGIRVRDRRGRPSALVLAPDLIPLATTPGPTALAAEATADGIRLTWQPDGTVKDQRYNVYRAPAGAPAWPEAPLNPEPLSATEYLDADIESGAAYAYTVRVSLAEGKPLREGESAPPCAVRAEDRFPPAAPTGFVGVQEGPAVRLFWNPSPERDIAGYRVYRSMEGGAWVNMTPSLLDQPSYLDRDVVVGGHVAYRVTAVDRSPRANESAPSATVEVELGVEPTGAGPGDR